MSLVTPHARKRCYTEEVYHCKVLAWRISNTMDSAFCVACLEEALQTYGKPEMFNTDQGCQFTSEMFTRMLKTNKNLIGKDGRGRALDNIFVERLRYRVKYEDTYLKRYVTVPELQQGLRKYFVFYNTERKHQSLTY